MIRSVFSIVLLALIGQSCVAEIVAPTAKPKHITDLYDAAIDMLMTCHGDPGNAVGILGDLDGSIVDALRSRYFVPVVLMNEKADYDVPDAARQHQLQSILVATGSFRKTHGSFYQLNRSRWWNQFANIILIDSASVYDGDCMGAMNFMNTQVYFGLLNSKSICHHRSLGLLMYNINQFTDQAPPMWILRMQIHPNGFYGPLSIFFRPYRKGGRQCEALNFPKTIDIGGWPLQFRALKRTQLLDIDNPIVQKILMKMPKNKRSVIEADHRLKRWFVENMVRSLNATAIIVGHAQAEFDGGPSTYKMGISLWPFGLSTLTSHTKQMSTVMIVPPYEIPMFALTKHTGHKSQLDKILTVIDADSRIGMWFVYLITFLFFKFFLRQAVMPSILNLVRLTCNTGLPNLPNDLASSIYLACLLMFVVTLQGIYTGNLATLLTTTIAYRNVQTRRDIALLGYTLYTVTDVNAKLCADPSIEGRVVEISVREQCVDYVLKDPLAVCVEEEMRCLQFATSWDLHISRDPIVKDYPVYIMTNFNPLGPRFDSIMRRWVEHGLWYEDPIIGKLRFEYVDDDEVKKNTDRRVMNLDDLCFAFVILGIGLVCSFVCFIGEIVVYKVRLKMAKRRNRVRARLAWGVKENSFFSFRSLNFRFNARRLFSRRR